MSHEIRVEDKQGDAVIVRDNPEKRRFEILFVDAEAETLAGKTYYLDNKDDRIFYHTTVDEAYGGRGLAGVLVKHALEVTADEGKTLVPVCPYVKSYVEKKGEVGPTRKPTSEDLALVKAL